MTEVVNLAAHVRDKGSRGTARHLRRQGRVPGVVYGGTEAPVSIDIDRDIFVRTLRKGGFMHKVVDLDVEGKNVRVLPRDVQFHPVTDRPLHVDFQRLTAGTMVRVEVPVVFLNMDVCLGLKRGGVLNIVRHEIEVLTPADAIPDQFVVDLKERMIGDAIHINDITIPEGVKPTITRNFTIATIVAPSAGEAAAGAAS